MKTKSYLTIKTKIYLTLKDLKDLKKEDFELSFPKEDYTEDPEELFEIIREEFLDWFSMENFYYDYKSPNVEFFIDGVPLKDSIPKLIPLIEWW